MHTLTRRHAPLIQPKGGVLHRPASSDAVSSEELLKGQKAIAIEHNGSIYRLQTTKLGKLILTK